jgi:ethanolamine utilization protein EutQ (cupin superfamily)
MAIEDRDDFVDVVAQAVIDRIEESHRVKSLVEQVVARVIEIQKKEAELKAQAEAEAKATSSENKEVENG